MVRLQNVGQNDRMVRIVLGLLVITTAFFVSQTLSILLLIVGILALITGVTGFCGIYFLLRLGKSK